MSHQENGNSKTPSDFEEIKDSTKEMIDMLENNFVLFQVNQEQLMKDLILEFSLKQRRKDEQQPLLDDLVQIDTSIKNLEQQAKDLKHSMTSGLQNLRTSQIELNTIFEKY